MLEILQFIFQDFWHFIGVTIILCMFLGFFANIYKEYHAFKGRYEILLRPETKRNCDPNFLVDPPQDQSKPSVHRTTADGKKFDIHPFE